MFLKSIKAFRSIKFVESPYNIRDKISKLQIKIPLALHWRMVQDRT